MCVRVCVYMCMPRCHTFRQLLVKMPHLLAGMCVHACVHCFVMTGVMFQSTYVCFCCCCVVVALLLLLCVCMCVHVYGKVSHLSAASSQGAMYISLLACVVCTQHMCCYNMCVYSYTLVKVLTYASACISPLSCGIMKYDMCMV